MVRVPRGWVLHPYAGSQPAWGGSARRIPVASPELYGRAVTVDLGNDGMAPQVAFTAAGAAQAFAGPHVAGESWSLDQCFLSTSVGPLDAAQCIVYAGPLPLAQFAVTGSLAGGGSQFGLGGVGVPFGWFVWAVWSGGTAGATAVLRVTGGKTALTA
jgi:hypothetical protein